MSALSGHEDYKQKIMSINFLPDILLKFNSENRRIILDLLVSM